MIAGVLAVADAHRADGRAVITAIALAYEGFCRLADEAPMKGWDQGALVAIGVACGAGKILGLDRAAMGNAISIAITTGLPLGVTRIGELSMWKGCATAAAVRVGVFATELAADGMTGPGHPFAGRDGLWQHVGIEAPTWPRFGGRGEPFRITRRGGAADGDGGGEVGPPDAGDGGPQHPLPGGRRVSGRRCDTGHLRAGADPDPAVRPLIGKLTVVEEPEFTCRYPAESCTRVEVTTTDGRRLAAQTSYPKGHARNPLADAEVEAKFRGLASGALGPEACDRVLAEVWRLDGAATLVGLFESLTVSERATGSRRAPAPRGSGPRSSPRACRRGGRAPRGT